MNQAPVAGIDVSKAFSDMCILAPDNTIHSKTKIYHDLTSMERALTFLKDAELMYGCKPVLVMEATAHYHRILQGFMQKSGYEVIVINPLQSGALKNINIRKIKNDRIDALKIAQLYRLKQMKPTSLPSEAICDLRELCRQRADLVEGRTAYINRLTALLDQVFPGYDKVFGKLTALSSLGLLAAYPTPEQILSADKAILITLIGSLAKHGQKYGSKKADRLLSIAADAIKIGLQRQSMSILIQSLVTILQTFQEGIRKIEDEIKRLVKSCQPIRRDVELLSTIPGIGSYSASVILSEIGDYKAFQKPKQLVAFFGLDPSERQSGTFKGTKNKISKRGSKYLRAILSMSTHVAINPMKNGVYRNPVLAEFYRQKLVSKAPMSARCAAMHKMVNIIFAVLRDQKPFELRSPEEHIKLMQRPRPTRKAA
jgi:transposase